MPTMQNAFKADARDNVVVALETLRPSPVRIPGEAADPGTMRIEEIPRGHKISLEATGPEEEVIKYGVCIGRAGAGIGQRKRVHLHNMHSVYDEHSSHLDVHAGAPKDIKYEQEAIIWQIEPGWDMSAPTVP